MTISGPRPLWAGRTLALLGIVLVALSLRTAVAALSPIVDHIDEDLPLDALLIAIVGTAPPIAFAASGFIAPWLARRIDLEAALLVAVGALVLGHLGRALAPEPVLLVVATVLTLLGAGLGGVLLPPAVKRYFPDRIGLVTSIYATVLSISTAVPALVAVPVADAAGWRASLGVWFFVASTAAIPWIAILVGHRQPAADGVAEPVAPAQARTNAVETGAIELADAEAAATEAAVDRAHPVTGPRLGVRLLRSPTAWAITAIFSVSAVAAYASFAWLPLLLVDTAGVTEAQAGSLLALYAIMGFPCSLLIPVLAARMRNIAPIIAASTAFFLVGYLGLLLAPATATWLWVAFAGLGPLLFPLSLVLINLRSRTASGSIALSGFVQGIGYVVGAAGPLAVGLLHDASDAWAGPIWFLLAVVALSIPAAVILARPRFVEDEARVAG